MSSSTLYPAFPEDERIQYQRQIADLVQQVRNFKVLTQNAAAELRDTADYLDKVWKDCRIASAFGSATGIVGGLLTVGGGIATILTAGIASPLLIAGITAGAAGVGTNLGTSFVEKAINSSKVKEADEAVQKACDAAQKVRETIELWQKRMDYARLSYLYYIAREILELDPMIISIMQGVLKAVVQNGEKGLSAVAETTTKAAGTAGVKIGVKAAGSIIIGTSAVFIVWDAVVFGLTVRDLIEKKGSDAAKSLRQKANEIEASLNSQ